MNCIYMSLSERIRSGVVRACVADPMIGAFSRTVEGDVTAEQSHPLMAMLIIEKGYEKTASGTRTYESNAEQCIQVINCSAKPTKLAPLRIDVDLRPVWTDLVVFPEQVMMFGVREAISRFVGEHGFGQYTIRIGPVDVVPMDQDGIRSLLESTETPVEFMEKIQGWSIGARCHISRV